jgi:hypothetical protein
MKTLGSIWEDRGPGEPVILATKPAGELQGGKNSLGTNCGASYPATS